MAKKTSSARRPRHYPRRAQPEKIKGIIRELLAALGEDPDREGLRETPRRVADFYKEALAGADGDPRKLLKLQYEDENHEEIVLVKDIPIYSLCEHHLLPFFGRAHIAYIPKKDRLLGISKLARLAEAYSRRLQLQERITQQIASDIMEVARPYGAMVVIEAEHFCMTMRGIKKPGAKVVTSAVKGVFASDQRTRAEAMSLITGR